MTGPDRFKFLSSERQLTAAVDWNRPDWPKLWLYNAHYFDDLAAADASVRGEWHRTLIGRWIAENPPGHGNGWEPYPLSLRIVNWLKWLLAGNPPLPGMADSLAVQVRWLRQRLEHHLLGNHLWANAKALVFAGACFDGDEARRWLSQGLRLVRRELREQVLADGGHFERSPMYHAIVAEDVLDLHQLAARCGRRIPSEDASALAQAATRMLRWSQVMSHPDGGASFFNDAALGIAPEHGGLQAYAQALGVPVAGAPLAALEYLRDSGYVRLQSGAACLLADVAPVGPDYLPGHAHADSLSFELSVHGRRVLVNGGTSTYENDDERVRQRRTAAHNTVCVDGQDSSEVWSAFRVARRARILDVESGQRGEALWLSAAHDGYRRLPGRVIHRRQWTLRDGSLRVCDSLAGRFGAAEARFMLAPGAELRWTVEGGQAAVEPASWHPRFGESLATRVLVVRFHGPTCDVVFTWD